MTSRLSLGSLSPRLSTSLTNRISLPSKVLHLTPSGLGKKEKPSPVPSALLQIALGSVPCMDTWKRRAACWFDLVDSQASSQSYEISVSTNKAWMVNSASS